jgi:octaprenyl-diphosphate synthase
MSAAATNGPERPAKVESKLMENAKEVEFLGKVEAALAAALESDDVERLKTSDTLITAGRHLCIGGGGKRIRPLMVRHFGEACGAKDGVIPVGVAAELVHSASLLHDDVVDAGMFRRGRPTVNALWGNITAVMAGDLLLTLALEQLSAYDRRISFDAVATVKEMTYATIDEVEARGDLSLPIVRFRRIAEGKTGALFGFCGKAAATLAGRREEVGERFDAFGRHLGVAFQIADDLKDLRGSEPGKPQFADFRSRTPSLPILLAARADEGLRKRIKDLWAFGSMPDERVKELGGLVLASGAPDEAIHLLKQEIECGLEALGTFAESDGGRELVTWARKLAEAFSA